mgnify:FL=1
MGYPAGEKEENATHLCRVAAKERRKEEKKNVEKKAEVGIIFGDRWVLIQANLEWRKREDLASFI